MRAKIKRIPTPSIDTNLARFGTPDTYVHEDVIADSTTELYFPGVNTCVAVVCVLKDRITGGHFTCDTPLEDLKLLVPEWKKWHKDKVLALYLLGPFEKWKDMKLGKGSAELVKFFKKELGHTGRTFGWDQQKTPYALYRATFTKGTEGAVIEMAATAKDSPTPAEIKALKVVPPAQLKTL